MVPLNETEGGHEENIITKRIEGPIYFYYELEDYFQNHRSYVKS